MNGRPNIRTPNQSWATAQAVILFGAGFVAVFALVCWHFGAIAHLADTEVNLLLLLLFVLNLAPALLEVIFKRFDPFDAKHLFLTYFFLIFTFSALCEIKFDYVRPGLGIPVLDATTRVRALAAILLGLTTFIIGCYLPIGTKLAFALPKLPRFPALRVKIVAFAGIASGVVAFYLLMNSAGGIANFLQDLGSWRTVGVLAGVGYLTFPISTVLPASVLLLLLLVLPSRSGWLTWPVLGVILLAILSLIPVLILGFRITLVPIVFQYLVVWHYQRARLRLDRLIPLGVVAIVLLSFFSYLRSPAEARSNDDLGEALLFRTPGLVTVERVVQRMDQGEPYRGFASGFIEAVTILVPRSIWPNKPQTAGLNFDDIFFYDFYIGRGDPIDGLKSGISPTSVGEALWIRGIAMVGLGFLGLGLAARTFTVWCVLGHGSRLHIFIYALFVTNFPIFVEAPQNAFNSFMMLGALSVLIAIGVNGVFTVNRQLKPA